MAIISFDEEKGLVTVELKSLPGVEIVFREPTTKDILFARSWFAKSSSDYQSDEFLNIKIIQLSTVKFGDREELPSIDEWVDLIALDHFVADLEVLGEVLDKFRVQERLSKQKPDNSKPTKPKL